MILVTGGAGFIGSNLHAALVQRGDACIIADRLGIQGKWRNLASHPPSRLVHPDALDAFLATNPPLETVIHLGAVSETTTTDGDHVWATNVELSWRLWRWCADHAARFIYASSASTYGDGSIGFDDDPALLPKLRPLNLYGWSKHAFDLRVAAALDHAPPSWAGLKFFNVYGPNEYHKGPMISVVKRKYDELAAGSPATLFRSEDPAIADGAQQRDFIWVGDVVDVLLWLIDHPDITGIYNVGTGTARSYFDLACAVCAALGQPPRIEFVPMPPALRGHYQSFTEARMDRLRAVGYPGRFTPLEEGVHHYIQRYLAGPEPHV
ncbi:MAG: ADP-glyceromanno-heptose 6-epimerase [Acetobacteraceae bacterium]